MPVIRAILLSLIVHFLLMLAMALIPPDNSDKHADVTQIEILTPEKKNPNVPDRQIVRSATAPDKLQATEDDSLARFLSEQKNRTRKETRAADSGLTQNRPPTAANQPTEKPMAPPSAREKSKAQQRDVAKDRRQKRDLTKEGFKSWTPGQDLRQQNRESGGAPSTVSDHLPTDVSVGSFTSLNTDQYTYYTFYARIEELIRFRWETRVQSSIDSFDRGTVMNVIGRKTWITNVEFLLSPDGRLQKSMIMKESGVPKFDQAAINAFKEANMFPNPPQELVEDDGFIHLKYAFAVYFNPSAMSIR